MASQYANTKCPASTQLGAVDRDMYAGSLTHNICYVTVINNNTDELKKCCKTNNIGFLGAPLWSECFAWCNYTTVPETSEKASALNEFMGCMVEETTKAGKANTGTNCKERNFVDGSDSRRNTASILRLVVACLTVTSIVLGRV